MAHTVLAPGAPWPYSKAPIAQPKKPKRVRTYVPRPDKTSPSAAGIRGYITANPGCTIKGVAAALKLRYGIIYDHVLYNSQVGAYRVVEKGVFACQ